MGHGYISFGIPRTQFTTDGVINQAERQSGLTLTGYLQFFEQSLASATIQLDGTDIVDFTGTSVTVNFGVNSNTISKTAVLQSNGSFSITLNAADLQSFGDSSPSINIAADYTTANNYSTVTGGDSIIGAANTTIQLAGANSNNFSTTGGFVSLSNPGTQSTSSLTVGSSGQLFRTLETSPSGVLPGFSLDLTSPTVVNVSATTANGAYESGELINLKVSFSEAITVLGIPQLELETGSTNRFATYISGSGSNELAFQYVVQSGDTSIDLSYASQSALGLAGGSLKDAAGNDAILTLPTPGTAGSLSANHQFVIGSSIQETDPNNTQEVVQLIAGSGTQKRLQFSLASVNDGDEIGFFTVDNAGGHINGLLPGDSNYSAEVLRNAQVLFSGLPGLNGLVQNFSVQRTVELTGGTFFRFFSITGGTLDSLLSNQTGRLNFSTVSVTPTNDSDVFTIDLGNRRMTALITENPLPLGVLRQGNPQGETIDLTSISASTMLNAVITTQREATFNNLVGFYVVNDANGTVTDPLTGQSLAPGNDGYVQAILKQRLANISLTVSNNSINKTEVQIQGGQQIAPFIVINDSIALLLDNNSSNDPVVYTPFVAANSDGFDHFRLLGDNIFAIEDMAGGGDRDFNDAIVQIQFTGAVT